MLQAKLVAAAQAHADHMARRGKLAHFGIGDGTPWDRIAATGYTMRAAAENVAWNQSDVAEVMRSWMNSPGHRRNILRAYAEFGAAVAYGKDRDAYWCAVFVTPGAARVGVGAARPPLETLSEFDRDGGRLIAPVRYGTP